MSWVTQRFSDISPVTLQVVGGAMSSSLYCGDVDGLALVESFMVELYRCKVCQFTCGLKAVISNHLMLRHDVSPLTCCPVDGLEAGLQQEGFHELDLHGETKQSQEDEDFLLYNMLDNMSPPTCDISTEGGLQVAHTCESPILSKHKGDSEKEKLLFNRQKPPSEPGSGRVTICFNQQVSVLFEEQESLKGEAVDLSCPINPSSTQEEMEQSAHLMTLGLCRISAVKAPPPPPAEPPSLQHTRTDGQIETPPPNRRQLLCFFCPLTLPSKRLLDVHVRSHQAGGGFICIRCSRTSDSWEELELHWRSHSRRRRMRTREGQQQEEKKKKKKCQRTNRMSVSGSTWNRTSDRWRSPLIGQGESKEAELSDSRSIPRKTRPHQTDSSQNFSGFRTTNTKNMETNTSHQKGLCCSLCHRTFSSKLTLRRHLGVHSGERPYTCPHCSYSSRLKASLLQHLRTHTGEKPYKCSECSYASIDRSSLVRHVRTHSQEKPYRCHLCTYCSIQKKSLDLHARRHHTSEAFPCQHCEYSSPDCQMFMKHIQKYHAPLSVDDGTRRRFTNS